VNEGEIDWDDLDPHFDGEGGDGYYYGDSDCEAERDSDHEVELLGDLEDADWDTPHEEEEF
jgi:hypothetical protein